MAAMSAGVPQDCRIGEKVQHATTALPRQSVNARPF